MSGNGNELGRDKPNSQQSALTDQFSSYVPRLLELVNDVVLSISPDARRVLYLNPAAQKLFAKSLTEVSKDGEEWLHSVHQEDREKLLSAIRTINQTKSFDLEFRFVQPDGNTRYLQGNFRRITSDHTELIAVGCIAKDVTNRIIAEIELEESKAIYHSLVESLPINVFRKDREGKIVFVNNKYCETIGRPREKLIGQTDFDLFETDLAEKYQRDDKWVLQTGLPFHDIEFHQQEGDEYLYVEILKAPVTASNGRRIGIQGMFWDVTDRKKAEIELEKAKDIAVAASQAKSDFLANVSHEIRTPLNAVIGMTDLLISTKTDNSQREYLKMIQDSGQSLLTLINDILDFSKIESGKLEMSAEWFDIREKIGDTLRSLALRAHSKNLDLICNIDPEIPVHVLGDSQRLRQIIVNLVGNSIKFTNHGEISVDLKCIQKGSESADLRFLVQDTGIGIPEDKLSKIFEEFVQVDTSTTRKYGGTGLGLTITSNLIKLMGGRLNVSSRENEGSSFEFTLPLQIGTNPSYPAIPANFSDVPVLVMVNNANKRESIVQILQSWRMKTFAVSNVEQGIQLFNGMAFTEQPIKIVVGETSSNQQKQECDCIDFANKLDDISEAMPIFISMDQSVAVEANRPTSNSAISQTVLQPIKYSELRDAISRGLEPEFENLTGNVADDTMFKGPHKILLAEDNPVNQKLAVGVLKKHGHEIVVADNGRIALDVLAGNDDFDVILMDIQMPELDGIEATKKIRSSQSSYSKIPIIAMTAHAMLSDRQRCLEAGMDEYLSKPFKAVDLMELIEQVLSHRSREMALRANAGTVSDVFIDWNQAFDTVGGDRKLLVELINVFNSEKDNMLSALSQAIESKNGDSIQRAAHSLKGTLFHLGASQIAEIAKKIEQHDENDWAMVEKEFLELQNQIKQLTIELESFTNS